MDAAQVEVKCEADGNMAEGMVAAAIISVATISVATPADKVKDLFTIMCVGVDLLWARFVRRSLFDSDMTRPSRINKHRALA